MSAETYDLSLNVDLYRLFAERNARDGRMDWETLFEHLDEDDCFRVSVVFTYTLDRPGPGLGLGPFLDSLGLGPPNSYFPMNFAGLEFSADVVINDSFVFMIYPHGGGQWQQMPFMLDNITYRSMEFEVMNRDRIPFSVHHFINEFKAACTEAQHRLNAHHIKLLRLDDPATPSRPELAPPVMPTTWVPRPRTPPR